MLSVGVRALRDGHNFLLGILKGIQLDLADRCVLYLVFAKRDIFRLEYS